MKYVAKIQFSEQVSPDDWALSNYFLDVDRYTTIGEVEDWVLKLRQISEARRQHFRLDVSIHQVDQKPETKD
jgi:hypothetical protein